jgi:DNA-binding transcriptional MocR family regulator
MRRVLSQRIARMADAVAASFPHECLISEPQGGFVLWVQMPQHIDALSLHALAVAQGVAFMPGQLFSASGKFGNCLRLNCGNAWSPEIDAAVARLGALVHCAAGERAA